MEQYVIQNLWNICNQISDEALKRAVKWEAMAREVAEDPNLASNYRFRMQQAKEDLEFAIRMEIH